MKIRGVFIEDTFAEAFTMRVARIIITGRTPRWVRAAALKLTGFATSVIGCKVEAGLERELDANENPDGRPGAGILMMTMGKDDLGKRLIERVGQTVLTCPTTACYDGRPAAPDRVRAGAPWPPHRRLRWAARGSGPGGRRLSPAVLRRRVPDEQGDQRAAFLADSS